MTMRIVMVFMKLFMRIRDEVKDMSWSIIF